VTVKTFCGDLLFITCASLSGQQAVPDVAGWNVTKWDMSLTQVKAAVSYPIEPIPNPTPGMPAKDTFQITKGVEVNGFPVRVTLHFSNDRLKSVELLIKNDAIRTAALRSKAFESFKQSLIEKFGKPANEDTKHSPAVSLGEIEETNHTVFWSFPSTSIRLDWSEMTSGGVISVEYKQVDKTSPL
jgi:hypothetical protein